MNKQFRKLHHETETKMLEGLCFNYLETPTNPEDSIPQSWWIRDIKNIKHNKDES